MQFIIIHVQSAIITYYYTYLATIATTATWLPLLLKLQHLPVLLQLPSYHCYYSYLATTATWLLQLPGYYSYLATSATTAT